MRMGMNLTMIKGMEKDEKIRMIKDENDKG